jgi:hypothetical protein
LALVQDVLVLGFDVIGKKPGTRINLGYPHASALGAVLSAIGGKEIEFLRPATESECKEWAHYLRDNLHRLRLIKGVGRETDNAYAFLVVQGTDIKRMFTHGHYRYDIIDFEPSWEMAVKLDDLWRTIVNNFIEFLDSCGGIAMVV